MTADKLTGIVLRNTPLNDSTSLLTLLTAERGKKTVTCHGARKLTSRMMPATQPFCFCQFVVSEKNNRLTLREASLVESFFDLRCDPLDCALGSYFLETAAECARENEEEGELLQLLLNCLYALCHKLTQRERIKTVYELRLLGIEGSGPAFDNCVLCGRAIGKDCAFDPLEGGIVCPSCQKESEHPALLLPFDGGAREALSYILTCPSKKLFSFTLGQGSFLKLQKAAEKSLQCFFEHSFDSLDFYKNIAGDFKNFM